MSGSKQKEINALIQLLDEPDAVVFERIKNQILVHGNRAVTFLEDAWENSLNRLLHERIQEILHLIKFRNLLSELQRWKKSGGKDILKGLILAAQYDLPDLDQTEIIKQTEAIHREIWLEINDHLTALEKIRVLNHIFFDTHHFRGNKTNFNHPGNYFIHEVFKTKKGSPVLLGALYIHLAHKSGIPVYGVDLPQHFILAYVDDISDELVVSSGEGEALFYINPFNRGAVFTRNEIDVFLKQLKTKPTPSCYKPCSNITIQKRLLENLRFAYEKSGNTLKAQELKELAGIL